MSARTKAHIAIEGASPRADFLPPATRLLREQHKTRRRLIRLLVLVLLISLISFGLAETYWIQANVALATEQDKTDRLLAEQIPFADLIAQIKSADQHIAVHDVVRASEINMPSLLSRIRASVPSGSSIVALNIEGRSALESLPAPLAVSGQATAAQVTVSLETQNLNDVESFLRSARLWPGYSSSTVNSMSTIAAGNKADLTIYLNSTVLDPHVWNSASMRKIG
ncbi:MAG: hypothetical protein RIR88_2 [Actinomycetota bacterium]